MEPSPPLITKKISNLARLSFFMIRKGFSKSKLVLDDLQFLMKRGKIMGKALNERMVTNNIASLSCRPRDVHLSFVSPMEYEFSCRTSPSNQPYIPSSKRRKTRYPCNTMSSRNKRDANMVFGAMVCRDAGDFESPLAVPKGARRRPPVVQVVRETTPFVLKDDVHDFEEDYRVDEAAEEFIQKFYTQLRLQKWLAVQLEASDHEYG